MPHVINVFSASTGAVLALGAALHVVGCGETSSDGAGGSTSSSGGASGADAGATDGAGGSADCGDLESQYGQKHELAKQCDPLSSVNQCTLKISYGLLCSCFTFVSSTQQGAVAEMEALRKAWLEANCDGLGAVCGECMQPTAGVCEADGGSGHCVDVY